MIHLNDFINDLWTELAAFNVCEIISFNIIHNNIHYTYAPIHPGKLEVSPPFVRFNFNINKVIKILEVCLEKKGEGDYLYYVMCDNAFILLITAFESYLTTAYNFLRKHMGLQEIDIKRLRFQQKENLKRHYKKINIEIGHLDENLWRIIFSPLEEKGLIEMRNSITHEGWLSKLEADLITHSFVRDSIIKIVQFISLLEEKIQLIIKT